MKKDNKTLLEQQKELRKALDDAYIAIWHERYNIAIFSAIVYSLIIGAAIEHFFPNIISWLWT